MFNVCAQEDDSSSQCNYGERSFNRDSESGVTIDFGQVLETDVLLNPVSFSPDIGQWPVSKFQLFIIIMYLQYRGCSEWLSQ